MKDEKDNVTLCIETDLWRLQILELLDSDLRKTKINVLEIFW